MLKVIKLSKEEQELRMVDPDWCYIPKGHLRRMKKIFRGGKNKANINTTTVDNKTSSKDFKKLWNSHPLKG